MNEADIYTDTLTALAKGTDAGLYRLTPEKVIVVRNEEDVKQTLITSLEERKTVTFNAAGTSLSGQAVTDSVLVKISPAFGKPTFKPEFHKSNISLDGTLATFPCSMTAAEANKMLKKYGRRLGPAPASIETASIGGIVANNASGLGYGLHHNSYHTVENMRIIFADGTMLDTGTPFSRQVFLDTHTSLLEKLMNIRMEILCDPAMADKIIHKYELKTTCGYNLNALLDYEDPYDILMHLMVGSEGTLGFISSVTFETIIDPEFKTVALVYFPNLSEACKAIYPLRDCAVSTAELIDGAALRLLQDQPGMSLIPQGLPAEAVAVLIQTEACTPEELDDQCREIEECLADFEMLYPLAFTTDADEYAACWHVWNSLFPLIVAHKPQGTVAIIEDVAFRPEDIEAAWREISKTLEDYGYSGGAMWGHLLDGSLHFTISPDFNKQQEVDRYAICMRKLVDVVLLHDGNLKSEHGTGRLMAPFVRQEWGDELYHIMKEIKQAFDPKGLLNPGVIINRDPEIFIRNLKKTPCVDERIDGCIECGFCERVCASHENVSTPRQNIAIYRAMAEAKMQGKHSFFYYHRLKNALSRSAGTAVKADDFPDILCPAGIDLAAWTTKLHSRKKKGGGRLGTYWGLGPFGRMVSSVCAWCAKRLHTFFL